MQHRAASSAPATGQLSLVNPKEIHMKKSLVSLVVLALFALGTSAVFGQVPEKCKNLTGDAQKKCIDDEKAKK
jgi:hypothetical protein